MEHLIEAFICVLRDTNDANDVMNNATALSDGSSNAVTISDHNRLGILDFPDTATQANLAASTSLSKAELLERAALSPSTLSIKEIKHLKQRYWLDLTTTETIARSVAQRKLLSVSQEYWQQATDQLKKVRTILYNKHEESALWNAEIEEWQRMMDASKQRQRKEVESRLATAQPWVKRLWDEDQGTKSWGYAVFCDPQAFNEEYEVRKDAALTHAREATGCGDTIGARWTLQYLDWPDSLTPIQLPYNNTASERPELIKDDKKHEQVEAMSEASDKRDEDITSALEARFQVLRQHFKNVYDRAHKSQRTAVDTQISRGALQDGVLRNVFLVINQHCVNSVLSRTANVDDMWVFAVDPDYQQPICTTADASRPNEYRGYMRVRLQQLANNFFDVRRFHDDEFPMQTLWRAAQLSRNQAFVSVKESDQQLWTHSRLVGSALRPEGLARSTVKLLY